MESSCRATTFVWSFFASCFDCYWYRWCASFHLFTYFLFLSFRFQVRKSLKWREIASFSHFVSRCWVASLASSLVVVAVSPQKILQMSREVQPMASSTWPSPRTQEKYRKVRSQVFLRSGTQRHELERSVLDVLVTCNSRSIRILGGAETQNQPRKGNNDTEKNGPRIKNLLRQKHTNI